MLMSSDEVEIISQVSIDPNRDHREMWAPR